MKKLISLFILCVLTVACNKKAAAPATTTTSPTPTITAVNSLDSCMIGDWAMDSTVTYNNGATYTVTPYTDPVNCHLVMTSTEATPGDSQLWKKGTNGMNCSNTMMNWRTNSGSPNRLDLTGVLYTIVSNSSTKLVLQYGSISPTGGFAQKYYLHK